jgi:peptide/nickel transport system permease protein
LLAYVARRLSVTLLILFGSSFLIYNMSAYSADPLADLRLSTDPAKEQLIITLTRELNLDVPPPLRYFIWLRGLLGVFIGQLDLGTARDGYPVGELVAAAVPTSVRLVLGATILAMILGIALGIISGLRQYSRFDYVMTFIAFLLFSLPIFWVAVLLKQFLAIGFNDFLYDPVITMPWVIGLSLFAGVFWSGVISGSRTRILAIFVIAFASNFALLTFLSSTKWFAEPALGPFLIAGLGAGIAFAVVQLSVGLQNRQALFASLSLVASFAIAYSPINQIFDQRGRLGSFTLMIIASIALAALFSFVFARVDRGPVIRTTIITGVLMWLLLVMDKLMVTWAPYAADDAINFRPVPTAGQVSPLLGTDNFWFTVLDILLHLFLPTIALTLISFAGYVRFTRSAMLEVLNQDYIRTARAKGLNERTVIMRHAFRNTLIPISTIVVVDFAGVIGGAIITEQIFGWYGMGNLFNRAINSYDLNLLMGVFILTAFLALTANLVADLLYSALDPRIRVGSGKQ